MTYLIKLTDAAGAHKVLLTLDETAVRRPALDVVFDVVGAERPEALVDSKVLSADQLADLKALQAQIFDYDAQGAFIREGVGFTANGRDLDPDAVMANAFVGAEREGIAYQRCDLVVTTPASAPAAPAGAPAPDREQEMRQYARMLFLHELSLNHSLDVTHDYPDLADLIAQAERQGEIEIDVPSASYRLTAEGRRVHNAWIQEAQDLVRRYDVYGDVDVDSMGTARFDTGMGKDLRVPIFELEGLDPFRARFLLGLNDGEWDDLPNWHDVLMDPAWYAGVFQPIETAPSVEDVGRDRLVRVMDQAKAVARRQETY